MEGNLLFYRFWDSGGDHADSEQRQGWGSQSLLYLSLHQQCLWGPYVRKGVQTRTVCSWRTELCGGDPHWSNLWRNAIHGKDSHWRSLWRTVSCGRDPMLGQVNSAESSPWGGRSKRGQGGWTDHSTHSPSPCATEQRRQRCQEWSWAQGGERGGTKVF